MAAESGSRRGGDLVGNGPLTGKNQEACLDEALILVVDDNPELLFTTQSLLELHGAEVITAVNGEEAVRLARERTPLLILMDVVMPVKSGIQAVRELKGESATRDIPVVLMSSRDELRDITEGVAAGAEDYIRKPFDPNELIARVQSALNLGSLYREVALLKRAKAQDGEPSVDAGEKSLFPELVGTSSVFQELLSHVLRFRDSTAPVLILGESGTGKELFARAVHRTSKRASGSFLAQNCAALHENLLESELFGYVKGAFTGAERNTKGLFESAHGGTLFLDEIGEMSLSLQAKLLRVLQEGVISPVGSVEERKVDVRIVAATHRDLQQMVEIGTFREDLLFRLQVLELQVPPLRERQEDIPLLAHHFLSRSSQKQGKPLKSLSQEAVLLLMAYDWPGNIRELENEMERVVSLSGLAVHIGPGYLSQKVWKTLRGGGASVSGGASVNAKSLEDDVSKDGLSNELPAHLFTLSLREALAEVEVALIRESLRKTRNNKSEAARLLGVSRSNLIAKVQLYNLEDS